MLIGLATGLGAAEVYSTNFSEITVNGTYKSVDPGTYADGAVTIGGGGVDWIGTCWQPAEAGSLAVDLNQGLGAAGWVQFNLGQPLVAGHEYQLGFWMAGNPDAIFYKAQGGAFRNVPTTLSLSVAVGENPTGAQSYDFDLLSPNGSGTAASAANMGWIWQTLNFVADGSESYVRFSSLTGDSVTMWGPVIGGRLVLSDITDINDITHAPEPGSLLLMGAGLAGLAAIRRRFAR